MESEGKLGKAKESYEKLRKAKELKKGKKC